MQCTSQEQAEVERDLTYCTTDMQQSMMAVSGGLLGSLRLGNECKVWSSEPREVLGVFLF